MNIVLWVLQILLALMFLMAGVQKVFQTAKYKQTATWSQNSSDGSIKLIGLVEVLGALGLILPQALGIAPILTPIAAIGLALTMLVAAVVHGKRKENSGVIMTVVLLVLALVIAVGRFM